MNLAEVVSRYRAPLIGLIASWGCPVSDATELAQDAFAEAYLHRDSMRGDTSDLAAVGKWLRGIARNLYRGWARARNRAARKLTLDDAIGVPGDEPEQFERAEEVQGAITRLPHKLRQAVLMHYLEETPIRDVATLLGVPEKTVEGRLYRARQQLRTILEPTASSRSTEGSNRD